MLARFFFTTILAVTASAAVLPDAWQDQSQELTFNICPELSVKCVLDGDWRHPIGYLGKRRTRTNPFFFSSVLRGMFVPHAYDHGLTLTFSFQRSARRVFDVINATKKATRGIVIENSESVMASAKRMDLYPFSGSGWDVGCMYDRFKTARS